MRPDRWLVDDSLQLETKYIAVSKLIKTSVVCDCFNPLAPEFSFKF
jgi:hypothetical protein